MFSCTTAQHIYCKNTVQLYSLQLNCTYSNYTQDAATCSATQQYNTFSVQILYKLYSPQMNCTYSNYTQAAATCSAAQQHSTFTCLLTPWSRVLFEKLTVSAASQEIKRKRKLLNVTEKCSALVGFLKPDGWIEN